MVALLKVMAGPRAYAHIRSHGLQAEHIRTIVCASGAAKTLTTVGLEKMIFGTWLNNSNHQIDLFGTSAGAFKLAAAARKDPAHWLDVFAETYCTKKYEFKFRGQDRRNIITAATREMVNVLLADGGAAEILDNPRFRLHCGTVRCRGQLASEDKWQQRLAVLRAGIQSGISSHSLRGLAERVIFSDPRSQTDLRAIDRYPSFQNDLTAENLETALMASGSIPVMMHGVEIETEQGKHIYRDGGMVDYHPVPSQIWPLQDGLVLYPHFYDYLKWRWFDKFYPWRKVSPSMLDNVVLLAPSFAHVSSLPGRRIPSRQDFWRYAYNEDKRCTSWQTVVSRSEELGQSFIELVQSGRIADDIQLLK